MREKQSREERRRVQLTREMVNIYETWDYPLIEHLSAADRIVRRMQTEFAIESVPKEMYLPYIQERFLEILASFREE